MEHELHGEKKTIAFLQKVNKFPKSTVNLSKSENVITAKQDMVRIVHPLIRTTYSK